jgi:hypothetical protein
VVECSAEGGGVAEAAFSACIFRSVYGRNIAFFLEKCCKKKYNELNVKICFEARRVKA